MDQADVLRFLPDVMRRTIATARPLEALCEAMVSMLDPVDRRLTNLHHYFDPFRAPASMLPYLATWVDLGWLPLRHPDDSEGIPVDRFRRLIALAPVFARRRGTAAGLETMLRVATGNDTIQVEDSTSDSLVTRPYHLVVRLPARESSNRRLVELIVQYEKPAHLSHEIALIGEP